MALPQAFQAETLAAGTCSVFISMLPKNVSESHTTKGKGEPVEISLLCQSIRRCTEVHTGSSRAFGALCAKMAYGLSVHGMRPVTRAPCSATCAWLEKRTS